MEDQLPEPDVDVLVYTSAETLHPVYLDDEDMLIWRDSNTGHEIDMATHWQPLPEAPTTDS